MIGDYYRYVAESADASKIEEVKNGAIAGYENADKHSQNLNPYNLIRLGLALKYSVFYYEVMNQHGKACELGEKALTEALEKIDDVDEETFRDAKSIIELLTVNFNVSSEMFVNVDERSLIMMQTRMTSIKVKRPKHFQSVR